MALQAPTDLGRRLRRLAGRLRWVTPRRVANIGLANLEMTRQGPPVRALPSRSKMTEATRLGAGGTG